MRYEGNKWDDVMGGNSRIVRGCCFGGGYGLQEPPS